MTTADHKIEELADKLQGLADRSAAEGGAKAIHHGSPLGAGVGVELLAHERFVDPGKSEGFGRISRSMM